MDNLLSYIAATVRKWMLIPAKIIDSLSGGRITPNHVTLISLLGHFGVVWALISFRPIVAALLLAFFGIMDSLDGALARLQKKASVLGMFYDASSDRAKELLVYLGLAVYCHTIYDVSALDISGSLDRNIYDMIIKINSAIPAVILVFLVYGFSFLISYLKAKGEVALSDRKKADPNVINRVFADGIGRYEVRMFILFIGLLSGSLLTALAILLGIVVFTSLQRLIRITRALSHV